LAKSSEYITQYGEAFACIVQSLFHTGKLQLTHEYIGLSLKGVEIATGLLQLLSAITFSGSRQSPVKCTDAGGPSLKRHRGGSSRNGLSSKFIITYRTILSSCFLLKAVFG